MTPSNLLPFLLVNFQGLLFSYNVFSVVKSNSKIFFEKERLHRLNILRLLFHKFKTVILLHLSFDFWIRSMLNHFPEFQPFLSAGVFSTLYASFMPSMKGGTSLDIFYGFLTYLFAQRWSAIQVLIFHLYEGFVFLFIFSALETFEYMR